MSRSVEGTFPFLFRVFELFGLVETPRRVWRGRHVAALGARFHPHLEGALQAARLLEPPVSSFFHELLPGNQDIAPPLRSVRPVPRTAGRVPASPPPRTVIITPGAGLAPVVRGRWPLGRAPEGSLWRNGPPGRVRGHRRRRRTAPDRAPPPFELVPTLDLPARSRLRPDARPQADNAPSALRAVA